jgi:hypothetical protein
MKESEKRQTQRLRIKRRGGVGEEGGDSVCDSVCDAIAEGEMDRDGSQKGDRTHKDL